MQLTNIYGFINSFEINLHEDSIFVSEFGLSDM